MSLRVRATAAIAVAFAVSGVPAGAADGDLARALAAERARPAAPRLERAEFLAASPVRAVRLSPDGRRVAWLEGAPDAEPGAPRALRVLDAAGGAGRTLVARSTFASIFWSSDGRWIFGEEPGRLSRVAVDGAGASGLVATLAGAERRELLGVDPSRPAAVLVGERVAMYGAAGGFHFRVARIDASGARELLYEGAEPVAEAAIGADGRIAFVRRREGDGFTIARARAAGGFEAAARCERLEVCTLLGLADGGRSAWIYGSLGGDRNRLLRLEADGTLRTVHEDPRGEADLDEVTFDPVTGAPLFASYRSREAATYPLAAEARAHWNRLASRLPGRDLKLQVGRGPGARWLVEERGDRLQLSRWYLFEPASGGLTELFVDERRASAPIAEAALARRIPIDWRAADGRRLYGFLSVPSGVDPKHAALVARVHGGPWNHVPPGFDPWVQLLVARGFAVFEPNFRGSTGFGQAYMRAAGQEFAGGRVQRDIVDGVRHLLASGIGDPERVGIVGASFGGYSALLGVTDDPALFRVAVAAAPPTDFGWTLRWFAERERPDALAALPLAARLRHLNLDPSDAGLAERLRAGSPGANAETLRRPLLLIAGGEDDRVALRAVLDYAARLRASERELTLYVVPEQGHAPESRREREAWFALAERMLHRHLGGGAPSPLEPALAEALRRNLRIDGGLLGEAVAGPGAPRTGG